MNNKHIIFCIIFASILFSCENKVVDYGLDKYFVEIVTAQGDNIFLLDNGKFIVATSDETKKDYTSGDRFLMNYTLLETRSSGDYNVRINGSAKIPLGKTAIASDSIIQTSANDPITLESVWLGSHYLNMKFYINYKSVAHSIGLIADSLSLKSDTVRMYFVHDTKNDPPGYPSHTYLSFDLKDVLGDPEKSRPISVQINTNNYGNKTYEFEY